MLTEPHVQSDPGDASGHPLFFACMACGDTRAISEAREHCLCGLASARREGGRVLVAGPGRVTFSGAAAIDHDDVPVSRPQVAVGT